MSERFFASCPRGLEAPLGSELAAIGATDVAATEGGVAFAGDLGLAYRANLETRIASRVLWRVGGGAYRDERDLYELVRSIDWARHFAPTRTLRVDEMSTKRASVFRRVCCALIDLVFCVLLSSPIALAMQLTGSNLEDTRVIAVLAGSVIAVTFIYLTLMTALTGRTWAMRLLSLRVIDTKTGLIPTGGQSIGRSIFYLISLATGVGILFALLSREGHTVHDRFTRTAVITT